MTGILGDVLATRIVAIVRLEHYDQAVPLTEALLDGGISAIEFTLTGSGALDAIAKTRAAVGARAQIGVGTVLTPDAAAAAISAGAQFVVTPAFRPAVIATCRAQSVPVLCGALTPTEVLAAHEAGADAIKIFPARSVGPQYLRDLLAPLPNLLLIPTGGIDAANARAYLDAGAVAVGIGGSLIPSQAVSEQDWAQITSAAQRCVAAIQ